MAIETDSGGAGSGTVIAHTHRNAWVLTCAHVVGKSKRCEVLFYEEIEEETSKTIKRVNAVVELAAPEVDLALLRVSKKILSPIDIAEEEPDFYEHLFVMGAPDGLWGTADRALLTSKDRRNGDRDDYQYTGLAVPGMSGGTLANLEGELVGVISMVKTDSHLPIWNIGFAVPLPIVKAFIPEKLKKDA